MPHPDVAAEQAHVDHAYERLDAMRAGVEAMVQDAFSERGGTFQSFTERDIRVRSGLSRLDQLQIGGESLVFGRIDRLGEGGTEPFHIGRLAVSDVDQEPLVVDWRAPVAEPFYRATGAHPMGLRRRRHFLTEGRQVLDLEDELFAAGPGEDLGVGLGLAGSTVLLAALERSRTGRMRDIVATVQAEQDEIIRAPLSGILVVQGGPGTGKTAVALHRAAYLLYTHRFMLESQGVLVVGPNPTFLHYIEQVLPSLGETGVVLSTIGGLYTETQASGSEGADASRLKGDVRMARFLSRAVGDRERGLRKAVDVGYGRAILRVTPELTARVVSTAKRRPGTHNGRRRLVENLLWRHLADQLDGRRRLTSEALGAEPSDEEQTDPTELGRELRHLPEVVDLLDRMWPQLSAEALLHDLFGARPLIELAGRGVLSPAEQELLYRPRGASLDDVAWTPADLALLDEAKALLGPVRRRSGAEGEAEQRTYGHIVVDEAQDLTPMALRMLARRSLSGSMTIVGDLAQATGGWAPTAWSDIVGHLPARRGWREVPLSVNYRTPSEIMEVAGRVLAVARPGASAPEAVRQSGEQPRILSAAYPALGPGAGPLSLGSVLTRTVAEELQAISGPSGSGRDGTVGIVSPPSLLAGVAETLEQAGIPFGRAGLGALDSPVSVLAIEDAKGLEFDAVIVVEPARLVDEAAQGMRALYVSLTRATRRLAVVHAEPLPAGLESASAA
jgi:hypothetical protein